MLTCRGKSRHYSLMKYPICTIFPGICQETGSEESGLTHEQQGEHPRESVIVSTAAAGDAVKSSR